MKTGTFILWLAVMLIVFAIGFYYLLRPEVQEPDNDKPAAEIRQRILRNDTAVIRDERKVAELTNTRNENKIAHIKEKPAFRVIDADSSVQLLSESLRQYAASKDSF